MAVVNLNIIFHKSYSDRAVLSQKYGCIEPYSGYGQCLSASSEDLVNLFNNVFSNLKVCEQFFSPLILIHAHSRNKEWLVSSNFSPLDVLLSSPSVDVWTPARVAQTQRAFVHNIRRGDNNHVNSTHGHGYPLCPLSALNSKNEI